MIVLIHVIVAISGIVVTTVAYFQPSATLLKITYGLVGATIVSGVYLVWNAPAHMLQTCIAGLAYTGIVTVGIVAARTKLAAMRTDHS